MPADFTLETERLGFRHFTDTDADAERAFELDSDPEVMRYLGPVELPTAAAYRERIRDAWLPQNTGPTRGVFATFGKANGEFVGWFFLRPAPLHRFAAEAGWTRHTDLEIGYRLRRAAWGRGLATEGAGMLVKLALADPDVTAVVAAALATNCGSRRVLEKVGMTHVRDYAATGYADPVAVYAIGRPARPAPAA